VVGHGVCVWKLSYVRTCALLGLVLGWLPMLFHGPIPEKFDQFYISGSWAVWAWYLSRMSIGLLIGVTVRPRTFWLRGLLVGGLVMGVVDCFAGLVVDRPATDRGLMPRER